MSATVTILTGGGDKPYALGLASALIARSVVLDFIGSDDLSVPELLNNAYVRFFNLRGDQHSDRSTATKLLRVASYYLRLLQYAVTAKPKIFHILWNNKFQFFDRTLLMLYYRCLGKKIAFTAHNVNAGQRDLNDSWINRFTLKSQYELSDHIFVHTEGMKQELGSEFGIHSDKVTVIPFGVNNTVPNTSVSTAEARRTLGLSEHAKTMLFFGNIAPYKGLEYLVAACSQLFKQDASYRLIIAGRPKGSDKYWSDIHETIKRNDLRSQIIERIEYIPDEETELYFKAADVLVLPYTRVFQSGVLFLGYGFGLPALVADVGNLKDEVIEGETGFVFKPQDSSDLAVKVEQYFKGDLFKNLEERRPQIKRYANERYSWDKVAAVTTEIYSKLLTS